MPVCKHTPHPFQRTEPEILQPNWRDDNQYNPNCENDKNLSEAVEIAKIPEAISVKYEHTHHGHQDVIREGHPANTR